MINSFLFGLLACIPPTLFFVFNRDKIDYWLDELSSFLIIGLIIFFALAWGSTLIFMFQTGNFSSRKILIPTAYILIGMYWIVTVDFFVSVFPIIKDNLLNKKPKKIKSFKRKEQLLWKPIIKITM